jgi:two-component system cell cycle response regulator
LNLPMNPARHPSLPPLHRVLFVDDDPTIGRAFARIVRRLGYEVDCVVNAEDALVLADEREYPVVVTDLMMPETNGFALVDLLSQRSQLTTFILVTGATDLNAFESARANERIASVLGKPIDPDQLGLALKQGFELSDKRKAQLGRPERSQRVLLVEDNRIDALLLEKFLLAMGGVSVDQTSRLADAVRILHDQQYDTIVTDLSLPDARGLDAVLRLRDCSPDSTLLVCSATSDEVLALQALELGAHDVVTKGAFDQAMLARAVRFARVRRMAERRLARLAFHDPLTGLANRAMFEERLTLALAHAKRQQTRLGLMFIDLDGFKAINDRLGHEAGDEVLREVAARIRRTARESDVVARFGGDEFAVLAPHGDEGGLHAFAERVVANLSKPITVQGEDVTVTASIGLSAYPDCGESPMVLLKLADRAMYLAKDSGKNRVQSSPPRRRMSIPAPS